MLVGSFVEDAIKNQVVTVTVSVAAVVGVVLVAVALAFVVTAALWTEEFVAVVVAVEYCSDSIHVVIAGVVFVVFAVATVEELLVVELGAAIAVVLPTVALFLHYSEILVTDSVPLKFLLRSYLLI